MLELATLQYSIQKNSNLFLPHFTTIFQIVLIFFAHEKLKKNTLKSCLEKLKSTFFPIVDKTGGKSELSFTLLLNFVREAEGVRIIQEFL